MPGVSDMYMAKSGNSGYIDGSRIKVDIQDDALVLPDPDQPRYKDLMEQLTLRSPSGPAGPAFYMLRAMNSKWEFSWQLIVNVNVVLLA